MADCATIEGENLSRESPFSKSICQKVISIHGDERAPIYVTAYTIFSCNIGFSTLFSRPREETSLWQWWPSKFWWPRTRERGGLTFAARFFGLKTNGDMAGPSAAEDVLEVPVYASITIYLRRYVPRLICFSPAPLSLKGRRRSKTIHLGMRQILLSRSFRVFKPAWA